MSPRPDGWVCLITPNNEWCTPDDPCFECAEAVHAQAHPSMDVDGCPTCHHRSVQLSPAATPSKTRKFAPVGKPKGNNSWERQVVTDSRGMPVLKSDGSKIRIKEYGEHRRTIEAGRRRLAQSQVSPQ